jgi:Bacterial regulatory helix-turn-helix protein, lysR family
MAFNELRAIATFAKAAELGSLRRAALAQAITPQAASQALAQLESHLGIRLFHRTTRSPAWRRCSARCTAHAAAARRSPARCASSRRAPRCCRCCGRCWRSSRAGIRA